MRFQALSLPFALRTRLFNLSLYIASAVAPTALSLIINPFLAANLSPEDYAIIGYFTSFNILILPLVSLSFINYYTRNYFLTDISGRKRMLNTLIYSLLTIGVVLFTLFMIVFFLYYKLTHVSFSFFPFALISFLPTYFSCFFAFYIIDKKMEGNSVAYFKATLINAVLLSVVSIILVVIFKLGAIGRLNAILIVTLIFFVFSLKKLKIEPKFDKAILRDAIKFCWPLTLSSVLYFFLSGVDKIFLEPLNDTTSFGNYNVAFQISSYSGLIGTALITTFDPDLYKAIASKAVLKIFKVILVIIIPCIIFNLVFIVFAEPIIDILTYGRYLSSTHYAQILTLRNISGPFYFVISGLIIGYGYPKVELINRVIGALLSIYLYKFLITNYGFIGASWGQVFSMILMSVISVTFILFKGKHTIVKLFKNVRLNAPSNS